QEPDVLIDMKEQFQLSDQAYKLLSSVQTVKREFSEFLLISDSGIGVMRHRTDPYIYWLSTSNPDDNKVYDEKYKIYKNDLDAITEIIKEKPYGV
ncbi:MAG: hypothetical protein HQ547_04315, partial [Candidatus Omnitrophica bacterium]|nr:hypothetical protein [Candidatus Omnitrophota bacterium]